MPSTTYTDTTMSVRNIGTRTNFAGAGVTDLTAEEDRLIHEILTEGIFAPADGYEVVAGGAATMNVVIGSGSASVDYAMIAGDDPGQANYFVRLDEATKTIALSAADPSLPRIDEVYVVVRDDAYDSSSRALPVLAVREGDPNASPSAPGADAAWKAHLLLATVDVPASAADILACTITDERLYAGFRLAGGVVIGRNAANTATEVRSTGAGSTIGFYIDDVFIVALDADGLNHGDLDDLELDQHSQYHNDARAEIWADAWIAAVDLEELNDVDITGPLQARDALLWDGASAFVDRPIVEADVSDLVHTTARTDEEILDLAGVMVAGGSHTFITAAHDDPGDAVDLTVPVKDEDNMASDSAAHLATQQSIKKYVDDAVVAAVSAIEFEESWSFPGDDVEVRAGTREIRAEENRTIVKIKASVTTAPTGDSIKADVHKDTVTVFTTQSNQPTIAISGFDSTTTAPDITAWAAGEALTIDIDQIGSTIPGAGFVLTVIYTKD